MTRPRGINRPPIAPVTDTLRLRILGPVIEVRRGYPDTREVLYHEEVPSFHAARVVFNRRATAGCEGYLHGKNNCILHRFTK